MTAMDLAAMEAEVEAYCRDKGWYDQDVPFMQAMALLHEEAAEVGRSWRDHGLADATREYFFDAGFKTKVSNPKPEGVGSEFADVLIRALDDSRRFGLNLPALVAACGGGFGIHDNFMVNVNVLHGLIARTSMAWDGMPDFFYKPENCLADVVRFTMQLCEHYGIDLAAEYARKMRYNKTRVYRHGGRRA